MRRPMNLIAFTIWAAALAVPGARAAEVVEREVQFEGADGTRLAGTLLLPAGAHQPPFPALVLLSGSGPTDRDGNQPPLLMTDLLKQVAQHLASRGVASVRFDKRGMHANADQLPRDPARYEDFFAWENFVGDAAAAYRFLRERPEIDPSRVGILGHSEGGLLALAAADLLRAEDQTPATLILLGTAGRPLGEVIEDQLRATLKRQGATAQQTRFFLDANARITKAIKATGRVPADVPAGLAALYPPYLGKFLRSVLTTDPRELARRYPRPVLVVSGAKDIQVSPEKDAKALAAALQSRKADDHELIVVPGASHNLKVLKGDDDAGFAGPVAPDVTDRLGVWVTEKLKGVRIGS